jgi:hypothetical protein
MENILIEVSKAYSAKFGKPVNPNIIANTLGFITKITVPEEISYISSIFEYLIIKNNEAVKAAQATTKIASSSDEEEKKGHNGQNEHVESALVRDDDVPPKWEIGSEGWWINVVKKSPEQNKTLAFHLKSYEGDWRKWIDSTGALDVKMARLKYIIVWAVGGRTHGLSEDDAKEAKAMLDELKTSVRKGEITDLGKKPLSKKQSDIEAIKADLEIQPPPPVRSLYELFGKYFPPRRSSDFDNFWIRKKHSDDPKENSWSLSEQTLKFCSYKNSEKFGKQIFTMEEIAKIVWCTKRLQLGIDYLNSIPPNTRILKTANWSSQFTFWNKYSCNAYRHFYESIRTSRLVSKSERALLRYWLCHDAATATMFYEHDTAPSTETKPKPKVEIVLVSPPIFHE